jgi:nitrite reductase/ring-hydroxylating ferredoxin subunit
MKKALLKFAAAILLIATIGFMSCRKDNDNSVPNTAVDIYIYLSNPSFNNLNAVGGWAYVTGGIRGILVYRKSTTEFMAFDRNCTYQPSDVCSTVYVDSSNIIAVDTCCNSQFSLYDGSVLQAPAGLPLKAYSNTFDGSVLHIYN